MQVILTIVLCSMLELECMAPYTFDIKYKDMYTCMLDGYEKSAAKIKELGKRRVNGELIFIKFRCTKIPNEEKGA